MQLAWPTLGNRARLAELERDLAAGKLAHAYLLAGPTEIGKFTAAKFFGQAVLCQAGTACGRCETCRQTRHLIHPDFTVVDRLYREGVDDDWESLGQSSNFDQSHRAKKPAAKTDTLGIADLRALTARLHTARAGWQVVVIHRVERLTTEAVNAFLKTLEEPPPRTLFLLTTDHLSQLLPTLISRCRVLHFGGVAAGEIAHEIAAEFPQLPAETRKRVVNFALGKPIRARRLAGDIEQLTRAAEYFLRLKKVLTSGSLAAQLQLAEEATATPAATAEFLENLTHFLRAELLAAGRGEAAQLPAGRTAAALHATANLRTLLSQNVNARLAVEDLLLKI